MDKAKRKGQPLNLRRYWIGFGVLLLLMLMPIRLAGYWTAEPMYGGVFIDNLNINRAIYGGITLSICLILLRFVYCYPIKRNLLLIALMTMTIALSAHHQKRHKATYRCNTSWQNSAKSIGLLQETQCTNNEWNYCIRNGFRGYILIKHTKLVVDVDWVYSELFPNQIEWNCG
ncbi:MAG: hypothetical protein AAF846_06910 [Chloroflexota bacterium]